MSETALESHAETEPTHTEQPAGTRPKGPFTAPRALPPASFTEPPDQPQDDGEITASAPPAAPAPEAAPVPQEAGKVIYLKMRMIRIDGGTQMRAAYDQATIDDYGEAMLAGAEFPPLVVYFDGSTYWLADGFHRLAAWAEVGYTDEMKCMILSGTRRDAILHAAGENAVHGLRRTNADKRIAVERLLRDEEWALWSDRKIAQSCKVSNTFVSKLRAELKERGVTVNVDSENNRRTYITKHGTTATMDTANIGKAEDRAPVGDEGEQKPEPTPVDGDTLLSLLSSEHPKTLQDLWRETGRPMGDVIAGLKVLAVEGKIHSPRMGQYLIRSASPAELPPMSAPTESEIDIAREFIIDALRKKYSSLARGQLYRDASRIAGASGIKRKAFDAALDAMIEAGSVKEHINPHGAREYHFADVVDRLDVVALSPEFKTRILDLLSAGPRGYSELRLALDFETTDASRMAALRRTLDLLSEEELIRESGGRYYLAESETSGTAPQDDPDATPDDTAELDRFLNAAVPYIINVIKSRGARQSREELDRLLDLERAREKPRKTLVDFLTFYRIPDPPPSESDQESLTVVATGRLNLVNLRVDELCATFDEDAVTLAGRTDDGARHRAIEIARKLVAAGIWNGSDRIEFDAYALHDRLFGVNRVEPSDLVEGDDYRFAKPAAPQPTDTPPPAASDTESSSFVATLLAYRRFAIAARGIADFIPDIRAAENIPWTDIDDQRRQEARELLDALSAAATDLPIILSEINQKLGAA